MTEIGSSPARQSTIALSAAEHSLFRALSLLPPDKAIGVRDIARALLGTADPSALRKLYHQLECTRMYPAYKDGGQWRLDFATLRAKIWAEERRAFGGEDQETLGLIQLLLTNDFGLYAEAACGRCNPQQLAQLALVSKEAAGLIKRLFRDRPDDLMRPSHGDPIAGRRVVTK